MEDRSLSRSIVLVHYHTPDLASEAVAALRAAGRDDEILLVDNDSTPEGREVLRGLPATYLAAGANLGYAGGANFGLARASGDRLVVMNPDVVVDASCLAELDAELDRGAGVAGPRFYWDVDRRFLLPPTEPRGLADELRALLARRGRGWARAARRRWRRHAWCCWRAVEPVRTWDLSGALLAFRRDAWDEVGRFDEGYRLYFEETDWLARARQRGIAASYVPSAVAVHAYARSTVREPAAGEWYEASARRYRNRHLGRLRAGLLTLTHRALARNPAPWPPPAEPPEAVPSEARWLEVAITPWGFPATARRFAHTPDAGALEVPSYLAAQLAGSPMWRLLVDDRGNELALL